MSAVIGNNGGVAKFINWQGNFLFMAFRNWYKHIFSKIQGRPEHVGCGQAGFLKKNLKKKKKWSIALYPTLLKPAEISLLTLHLNHPTFMLGVGGDSGWVTGDEANRRVAAVQVRVSGFV